MFVLKVVGLMVAAFLIISGGVMLLWCALIPENTPEEQEEEDQGQWDYLQKRRSKILDKEKRK